MSTRLFAWLRSHRVMFSNAASLMGAASVTSLLGFVFWLIAAHLLPARAVGLGSAAISAMMLLAQIGMLGFGTLLVGELSRHAERRASLIATSLLVSGVASTLLGVLFAVLSPLLSHEFQPLASSAGVIGLFGIGVGLSSATLVLDSAMIGLLRGHLQLWRNVVLAATKLGLLALVGLLLHNGGWIAIYATWVGASVLSLIGLAMIAPWPIPALFHLRFEWNLLRRLAGTALQHHVLNLGLSASGLALPVIVTVVLSAKSNAYFYSAWMMVSLAFYGLTAVTLVLFALGSYDARKVRHSVALTLTLSVGLSVLSAIVFLFGASFVLRLLGPAYAQHAATPLRLLSLGCIPLIVKTHYVAIRRIERRVGRAAIVILLATLFELSAGAVGAKGFGLVGLSVAWVLAVGVEAVFMAPAVFRVLVPHWVAHAKEALPDRAMVPASEGRRW